MAGKRVSDLPDLKQIEQEVKKEDSIVAEAENRNEIKKRSKKFLRTVIFCLFIIVIGMGVISVFQNQQKTIYSGTGSVSGNVVNPQLTPVQAEVSVLNTDLSITTDSDGTFSLGNIPAGAADIIIAYQGQGVEVPVVVEAENNLHIGQVIVESTQIPGE